jgi:hydroxypyruvate isomerase
MLRFCANLSMLYNEVDFLDRFAAAAADGFEGVEYLFPYPFPKEELAAQLQQHGLVQVLHNLPAGNWGKGERGLACPIESRRSAPASVRRSNTPQPWAGYGGSWVTTV